MVALATDYTDQVRKVIDSAGLGWSITQLGARAEYRFVSPAPRSGGESAAATDEELDDYMHLYMLNRSIMMTPFHNMALMCPATTRADVDRHTAAFREVVGALYA